jgi:hypothetical protein
VSRLKYNIIANFIGRGWTAIMGLAVVIGVNLSQNAYSQKISLKAGGSKSRLKKG